MLHIHDLDFNYMHQERLFSALNLQIGPGKIYGLLGKNGTGKTTLLRLIAGLLLPKEGSVNFLEMKPGKRLPAMLQELYLLPEEFDLPEITIEKYLQLYAPFYPRFSDSSFKNMLVDFGLKFTASLNTLSYGQKKKFLLAFGLASNCKLLLLDEPTNGLDIPSKSAFRKVVAGALDEERTFIISTHQVRDVENLIDGVVILDDGKVLLHVDLNELSEKFVFGRGIFAEQKELVYQEPGLRGGGFIRKNSGDEDSLIDLELLFSAVIDGALSQSRLMQ